MEDARAKIEAWRRDYNESRSHTSLGWRRSNMLLPLPSKRPIERRKPGHPQRHHAHARAPAGQGRSLEALTVEPSHDVPRKHGKTPTESTFSRNNPTI
ncbi:integrase core domain-containing protein [Sphingomonas sp.]|uniref:integrase core domain-containing protein n=1 Tax=Sphingomonas sp. TaxID=28214 RepID=UPI003B001681